ncbi:hypothetical protein TEA_025315 [Camellia sinensis var. sinensis]|uniref:C2 domain-containing protein n=1 Tax=Camellia sinensis var. sinensis TaxID=542762 RepID=A0A4S4D0K1_CAMSN|nr:hypothetical protein TEA_025315 [Camellia sinensis var. sinensis]
MEVCAYIFISGGGKQKIAVDRDGDTNPTWNGQITFNLGKESTETQIVVFELNCCDQNGSGKVIGEVFVKWEDENVAGAGLSPPPPAMAAMTSLTACYPPPVMGPRSYGAAAAVAGQYNSPCPPPAMVQVQEQAEPTKKKKGGWFARVLAAAAISDVLNDVSLLDDLGF